MPFPITPSQIKALLPTTSGTFCERFKRLLNYPTVLDAIVGHLSKEDGTPTDALQADICSLNCTFTGGPPNPDMPTPVIQASDGTFDDKVRVTWGEVVPASGEVTFYKVYRAASTETNPANATLVGTTDGATFVFDDPVDADLVVGTIYRYWVTAGNISQTSAYSAYNDGNAGAPAETLPAISDLKATVGFGNSFITLWWTPPAGATRYDVYRHTANVFADATLIYLNVTPASTTLFLHPTHNPECWDNVTSIMLEDTPLIVGGPPTADATTDFYYWVISKKDSPPATSPESNGALGRINAPAIYDAGFSEVLSFDNDTYTIPAGVTKMWVVARGGGAAGAGGASVFGGGGGGGGGTVMEAFTVSPGDVIDWVTTGTLDHTASSATGTDGEDGAEHELQINTVAKITVAGGLGGLYNPAGNGAGGAAGTGTGTTSPTIYAGESGLPAVGSAGGRSGLGSFQRRLPRGVFLEPSGNFEGNGTTSGHPGSGASAVPVDPNYSVGGWGKNGTAFLAFGT